MEKQGCWNGMGRRGCMEAVADLLHVEMREVFAVEGVAASLFFLAEDGLYAMAVQADLLGTLSAEELEAELRHIREADRIHPANSGQKIQEP